MYDAMTTYSRHEGRKFQKSMPDQRPHVKITPNNFEMGWRILKVLYMSYV